MMILAVETATTVCSVALAERETLVAEKTIRAGRTHSETLMPHIRELLSAAGADRKDIGAVAVSIGPGSFTGLRIGMASVKALAYAWRVPLVGVPTLEALAGNFFVPGVIVSPLLDAQKGNVYQAVYRWNLTEPEEIVAPRVVSAAEALDAAAAEGLAVILGEAAGPLATEIANRGGRLVMAPPHLIMPRAGSVAFLAHIRLASGQADDPGTLEPFYVRRSEAEELWEKRRMSCR